MEQSTNNSVSEEPFNICLTNNYAFLKIFKKDENVKGFLIDLLNLKEKQIKKIEIKDPFTSGENKEEKDIKLLLIYSDKDDLNQSINNIENWFKARLDLENIKVIIQKN